MSIRTTEDEVAALLVGVTISSGDLDGFITDASLWVDNYLVDACTALPADKLPIIEKYIAAHLYTQATEGQTGQLVAATRQDVSERYAERKGSDAGVSSYIRTAVAFDPCGIVAKYFLGHIKMQWRVGAGYQSTTGAP